MEAHSTHFLIRNRLRDHLFEIEFEVAGCDGYTANFGFNQTINLL